MATALELAFERAMLNSCYSALGRSITYTSITDGDLSIIGVPDSGSELANPAMEVQTTEKSFLMRVKKSDVAKPRKGDRIEDTDEKRFLVDFWEQQNDTEWLLTLRLCDDG